MQVWIKGIITPEHAALVVDHDVDGIIVSNHRGRQLDGTIATRTLAILDALPEIVTAVNKRIPDHNNGGVRQGTDIFQGTCSYS
jgi:(S)-2-hydroxy-acid oxidase